MKIADLDVRFVDAELDRRNYLIVKDESFEAICASARQEYERSLKATLPHAPGEKFAYESLATGPWRKFAIGSRNGVGEMYAQNLQTTYFQWNSQEYPSLARLFSVLIGVRNKLMRVTTTFGEDPVKDKFWNACRIHHYPRGGGFMSVHKDTYFPVQLGDKPFYQVSAALSRKGTDFMTGGGIVFDSEKKKVDLEAVGGFGSLVIFDGRGFHGVEDVDLDQVFDFSRTDGRLAAFVSLYVA